MTPKQLKNQPTLPYIQKRGEKLKKTRAPCEIPRALFISWSLPSRRLAPAHAAVAAGDDRGARGGRGGRGRLWGHGRPGGRARRGGRGAPGAGRRTAAVRGRPAQPRPRLMCATLSLSRGGLCSAHQVAAPIGH